MRFSVYVFFVLWPLVSHAQQGHYFLSHYAPGDEQVDHAAFDIAQDAHGVLYFATRTGVLQFDGKTWEMLPGHGAVYAIEISEKGEIFWAGARGFGGITQMEDGSKAITLLSEPGRRDFYQIQTLGDQTFFLNNETVFVYEKGKQVSAISANEQTGAFTILFELFGKPYAGTDKGGVFRLDKEGLTHVSFNRPEDPDIVFTSRLDNHYLLGTSDNRLFLCRENMTLREIVLEDDQYINASVIVSGSWVNNRLIALGTLRGGVIFVNPMSGKIEEIINYHTGLPDNEIFALMVDQSRNIWVTHDYGFTRIAPFLPFRSFSHYEGLNGNLLCATSFNDEVYVGTSLGLFRLVKEETYDSIVYYVYFRELVQTGGQPARSRRQKAGEEPQTAEETEKKRGFLWFLKRNREEVAGEEAAEAKERNKASSTHPQSQYVIRKEKRTERVLRSSHFVYRKVKGIDAKVTHLAAMDGHLIASGLGGVFEVSGQQAAVILEEPARFIFPAGTRLLIASTYSDKLRTFRYDTAEMKWARTYLLDTIDGEIPYIFEGQWNDLWLVGMDQLYRVTLGEDTIKSIRQINFSTPGFSKTSGMPWEGEVVLTNADGFFRFDERRKELVRIDTLPRPKTYFASTGNVWYQDEHTWHVLGQFNFHRNAHMLNLCQDIRFISSDEYAENIWVITGANELYRFFGGRASAQLARYPLYLKSIIQADKKIAIRPKLKVDEEAGGLVFEVAQPQYTAAASIEYRYLLAGIHDDWSAWSPNNRIDFPYLPPGSYTLTVQSRDVFGDIQEIPPISFQVQPPYWKTPWFYALEFTVFALLVVFSFKLSIRYRIISRILSLLTIILLIEFIQTIAGYTFSTGSSPVIDFLLQVLVAFMVLPVEGFLRDLMFRPADSRLYKVIKDLERQEKGQK